MVILKLNRGSLLYESLFAFVLFTGIVILIISLYSSINKGRIHIFKKYNQLIVNEEYLSKKESFIDVIDMVLH